MCRITGWVSFERDLTKEGDVLESMTRTMAARGALIVVAIWVAARTTKAKKS